MQIFLEDWQKDTVIDLERHEAYRPFAYDDAEPNREIKFDVKGNLTIGIGLNLQAGISKGLAVHIVEYQVHDLTNRLQSTFWWWAKLSGNRKRALTNLAFNMGIGVYGQSGLLDFARALLAMEQDRYEMAAIHFLDSKWAVQVGPNRSKFVTDLIRNG